MIITAKNQTSFLEDTAKCPHSCLKILRTTNPGFFIADRQIALLKSQYRQVS